MQFEFNTGETVEAIDAETGVWRLAKIAHKSGRDPRVGYCTLTLNYYNFHGQQRSAKLEVRENNPTLIRRVPEKETVPETPSGRTLRPRALPDTSPVPMPTPLRYNPSKLLADEHVHVRLGDRIIRMVIAVNDPLKRRMMLVSDASAPKEHVLSRKWRELVKLPATRYSDLTNDPNETLAQRVQPVRQQPVPTLAIERTPRVPSTPARPRPTSSSIDNDR